jgi:flagellar biosynthesis protein FlhG
MLRRILPVASGKGGVGKTTFAVNFALALSRAAPTLLVDLDTGTSSVRTALPVPVRHDLYHFHRKGVPLADCITRLGPGHDPEGRFANFGFIAGPRHYIEELANPGEAFRRRIAAEINRLPAEFVVLDLRAGHDGRVIDFLPYTNSGILIFTPQHPAATLAAADVVKAILFRSLRALFAPGSRFYARAGLAGREALLAGLLDRAEDGYDDSVPNLDAFLLELGVALAGHPLLGVLAEALEGFRVHYVLNMFNGVEQSYEAAIVPFVESLAGQVSARLRLSQLGWIVFDERVHQANASGFPIVLDRPEAAAPAPAPAPGRVEAELAALESAVLGSRRPPAAVARPADRKRPRRLDLPSADDAMAGQLQALKALYSGRRGDTARENFVYLAYRALDRMAPHTAPSEFGHTVLAPPEQLLNWFLARQRSRPVGV